MKIIRLCGEDLDFHPDSALLLPGHPMFYPDFGGEWTARLMLAVHINRLGKTVSVKFASRYYDALSIALMFAPSEGASHDTPIPLGILSGMDSTITHGLWLAPDEILTLKQLSITTIPGSTTETAVEMPTVSEVDSAVAHSSTYTTIRMGDILLMPLRSTPSQIALSARSRLCITTSNLLNLKIV